MSAAHELERLDARAWAPLVRALRTLASPSEALAAALVPPTSALTSGPPRRALCAAIAADASVVARLLDDTSLPAAVHRALGPVVDGGEPGSGHDDGADGGAADDGPDAGTGVRAQERMRALRRSVEDERRRREGAEARADAAEARAAAAVAAADASSARVRELEVALAAADESLRQAVARAERRGGSRLATLEDELATARSEAETQRREHERARTELATLRAELEALRARSVDPVDGGGGPAAGRPLVLPPGLERDTTEAARWLADRSRLLLVDGYNVVLTLHPGRPLEEQRRWLVDRVRPLVVRDGARPVVVFDGAGVSGRMRDTGGVEVRFTAGGASADDEIVFMVAATDEPVLVVTDDAELRARVRAEGGDVVGTVHLLGIVGA